MLYFSLSLFLSLLLSAALLACLIKSLRINWSHKNRRPLGFLTPVVLSGLFVLATVTIAVPRILDVVSMVGENYVVEHVEFESDVLGWSSLEHNQQTFYYNQWRYDVQPGKTYRISYTPNSRFIVFFDDVSEAVER